MSGKQDSDMRDVKEVDIESRISFSISNKQGIGRVGGLHGHAHTCVHIKKSVHSTCVSSLFWKKTHTGPTSFICHMMICYAAISIPKK